MTTFTDMTARHSRISALILSLVLVGAGVAAQETQDRPKPEQTSAAQKEVSFDELPEDIRTLMREEPTVRAYLDEHPETQFRLMQRGTNANWRRVTFRKGSQEDGFLIFQHGKISLGRIDGKQLGSALVRTPTQPAPTTRPTRRNLQLPESPDENDAASNSPAARGALSTPSSTNIVRTQIPAGEPLPASENDERPSAPLRATPSSTDLKTDGRWWLPMTGGPALMWISTILILALTLRTDRWLSLRNLDGLVLAAFCPLLLLRDVGTEAADGWAGFSPRWWIYSSLSVLAGYWLLRGLILSRSRSAPAYPSNVSPGAMLVLLLFSCCILATRVSTGEPTRAGLDGIVGGRFLLAEGKLPYGHTPGFDARSPLIYALHAGAMKLAPAYVRVGGNLVPPEWTTRETWLRDNWWRDADLAATRIVNGVLAAATLLALILIGKRLHSTPAGLTMAAVFGLFPGTVEAATDPAVMLPAALLAWSICFAAWPRFGGLLSLFTAVFAGLAWPYAWLAVPVLIAYFLRQQWRGLGAIVGTLAGASACVAGLTWLVQPALPRPDGALLAAGESRDFVARSSKPDTWLLEKNDSAPRVAALQPDLFKTRIWERLLTMESINIAAALEKIGITRVQMPPGVESSSVLSRHVNPADAVAQNELPRAYATAAAALPFPERAAIALRTVLEATWLPIAPIPSDRSTWDLWTAASAARASKLDRESMTGTSASATTVSADDQWAQYRRIAKIGCGVWCVLLSLIFLFGRRKGDHNLIGGLMSLAAWITLIQTSGAVADLPLLIVAALAILAANHEEEREFVAAGSPADMRTEPRTIKLGAAPRISVE